jgi:perosamine synthetase
MNFIPVCEPYLNGNEKQYVNDCLDTGWISSAGKYVNAFEEQFARYCGVRYGVGVCNGTVALHLALTALGITKGDEVIVPNFTMIASAFAICYTGAMPVFVDAEPETWNIDTNRIEEKITPHTKAIMPVSIFGHPCDMDEINALAKKYNLAVVEDAAESHGAEYKNKKTGALADITAFSFFANKNITTGEGGMVVTDSESLYNKAKYYKNLCFPLNAPRNYIHEHIGFQYRMTNIQAAIGLAQTEKADDYKAMRIKNAALYQQYLKNISGIVFQQTKNYAVNVHWMNAIVIEPEQYGKNKDELMVYLRSRNVDTRLLFVGMNRQPALQQYGCNVSDNYPVTQWLSDNGFYLPSASNLSEENIKYICEQIINFHNL